MASDFSEPFKACNKQTSLSPFLKSGFRNSCKVRLTLIFDEFSLETKILVVGNSQFSTDYDPDRCPVHLSLSEEIDRSSLLRFVGLLWSR